MDRSKRGALAGITAAMLFGASTPLAKELLGDVPPQLLAGMLYGGAAVALSVTLAARRSGAEAPLRRSDAPILGAITLAGGVVAPVPFWSASSGCPVSPGRCCSTSRRSPP